MSHVEIGNNSTRSLVVDCVFRLLGLLSETEEICVLKLPDFLRQHHQEVLVAHRHVYLVYLSFVLQ